MQNFVSEGDVLPFTAPTGGVTSGTPVQIGQLLVVPVASVAAGAQFQGKVEGVFDPVPKATGQAWTEGELIYWDATAGNFTTTSTGNLRAGCVVKAAQAADTTGRVFLHGMAAPAGA